MSNFDNGLKPNSVTLSDKVRLLLEKPYKIVLVQRHELEKLRIIKSKNKQSSYINYLYDHYIVKGLEKTYIKN